MAGTITPLPQFENDEDLAIYEKLEPPKSMVVRYGSDKLIAELAYSGDAKPGCGSKLVIRTDRGTELATMLTTTCDNSGCGKSVSRKQMLQYIDNSGGKDYPFNTTGKVVRVATIEDLNTQEKLEDNKKNMIKETKAIVAEMELDMRLVDIEQLLGGERVIFHYTAEDWIDFRELVKKLAAMYHARIEMRQVNARDEARLVADYEKCGMHCCCKQFLKVLKPVSMRSAKVQKATLDPTKVSGRCGRLMCCLRYEDQTYSMLKKKLPHKQTRMMTEDGAGTVLNSQILTQLVLIRLDSTNKVNAYPLEDTQKLSKEEDEKIKADLEAKGGMSFSAKPRRGEKPEAKAQVKTRDNDRRKGREEAKVQEKPKPRRRKKLGGKTEPKRVTDENGVVGGEQPQDKNVKNDSKADENKDSNNGKRKRRRGRGKGKDGENTRGEGSQNRTVTKDEPRRPQPGKPLNGNEIESAEGTLSGNLPADVQTDGDDKSGGNKKRRRRRGRGKGKGEPNQSTQGENNKDNNRNKGGSDRGDNNSTGGDKPSGGNKPSGGDKPNGGDDKPAGGETTIQL